MFQALNGDHPSIAGTPFDFGCPCPGLENGAGVPGRAKTWLQARPDTIWMDGSTALDKRMHDRIRPTCDIDRRQERMWMISVGEATMDFQIPPGSAVELYPLGHVGTGR
jgi:hypothetical protein